MEYSESELCQKYRLPTKLIQIDLESIHKGVLKHKFIPAVASICDSQIKWLLKLGWRPPEIP
jgi:hypothetical protein